MSVPLPCRAPLADLMTVAAELARTGNDADTMRAREVKAAHDTLKRALCDHREGFADHLTMGGTVTRCKGCGAAP